MDILTVTDVVVIHLNSCLCLPNTIIWLIFSNLRYIKMHGSYTVIRHYAYFISDDKIHVIHMRQN